MNQELPDVQAAFRTVSEAEEDVLVEFLAFSMIQQMLAI